MSQKPDLPEAGQHNLRRALLNLPRHEPEAAVWLRIEDQLHDEHNLRRAIRALPGHEPAAALWPRIETQLTGEHNLQRALRELPRHEPAEALWARIDNQLTGERAVSQAATFLPAHEPDDDLWAAISARLDDAPSATSPLTVAPDPAPMAGPYAAPAPVLRRLWTAHLWRVAASAAAAVLLVAAVWWQRPRPAAEAPVAAVKTSTAAHETISYSEEVVSSPAEALPTYASFDPLENQGVSFIDAHCTSLPTVCRTSEFQELRTQLTELEAEEKRLQQDAHRFGNTPELVQDQVRVTTLKATVTRELIQMIIS